MGDGKDRLLGSALLGAGAIFIFREAVAWFLGQILSWLPLPKLPNGTVDMSALPWGDIVGILLLVAGLVLLWRSRGKHHAAPRAESNLTAVEDRIQKLESADPAVVFYDDRYLKAELARIDKRLGQIVEDYQRMRALEGRFDEETKAISQKIDTLFLALQAIRAIGEESALNAAIRREAEFLTQRISEGQPVKGDDWAEWQKHHRMFDNHLAQWLTLASGWHPKADALVTKVDLSGEHPQDLDGLFDGSKAVIAYRTFVQKFENWRVFEKNIRIMLHIAAFGGPDAKEVISVA